MVGEGIRNHRTVVSHCKSTTVRILSVADRFSVAKIVHAHINGAMGKMLVAVLLGVAEMEQETRREGLSVDEIGVGSHVKYLINLTSPGR